MAAEGRDELDVVRARQLAWRLWNPARAEALAVLEASEPTVALAPAPDLVVADDAPTNVEPVQEPVRGPTPEDGRREEALRAACEALADGVDRAWGLRDAAQAAAATGRLVRRAASLGMDVAHIGARPMQSVRLARLAVRHFSRLPKGARTAFAEALLWLDLSHQESADLLVDVARTANSQVAGTLQFVFHAGWDPGKARASFVVQLAALLDDATSSWTTRLIALDWLAMVTAREAVGALRAMLTQPHLGVRGRALEILLGMESRPLTVGDVSAMVGDLLVNPMPDANFGEIRDAAESYCGSLAEAIEALRPANGAGVLLGIIAGDDGNCANRPGDPSWALRTLAGAYPEHALDTIDEWLDSAKVFQRVGGVEAAARLPRDEALPRLRRAAADGSYNVSLRARDLWLAIVGTPCRLDPLEGVNVDDLSGPPSERMRARMLVLRQGAPGARAAMAQVLLSEAPDPEALALLIFILADEDPWQRWSRPTLPRTRLEWIRAIVAGFGQKGAASIFLLVRDEFGADTWMGGLVEAVKTGAIPQHLHASIAAGCVELLGLPFMARELMIVLKITGIPAGCLDALWRFSIVSEIYGVSEATQALVQWPPDPLLDDRLVREMNDALARGDLPYMAKMSAVAIPRKLVPCCEAVRAALPQIETVTTHEDYEALRACAFYAFDQGELRREWVVEMLQRPDLRSFAVACDRVTNTWFKDRASPWIAECVEYIKRGLASKERHGATAAEAAETLLLLEVLPVGDRRIAGIVRRAPHRERVGVMRMLAFRHAPLKSVWPALAELFASDDPVVVKELQSILSSATWGDRSKVWPPRPRLREVLPITKDPVVHAMIEDALAMWNRRTYWVDKG